LACGYSFGFTVDPGCCGRFSAVMAHFAPASCGPRHFHHRTLFKQPRRVLWPPDRPGRPESRSFLLAALASRTRRRRGTRAEHLVIRVTRLPRSTPGAVSARSALRAGPTTPVEARLGRYLACQRSSTDKRPSICNAPAAAAPADRHRL
jgi:hypothetical protein